MVKDPDFYQNLLSDQVATKERRKLKARRDHGGVWYGLGMFGLVGWSIAIPTVIGVAIGVWLDRVVTHRASFTLMCLFVGVVVGCSVAWYWVQRESQMDSERDEVDTPDEEQEEKEE